MSTLTIALTGSMTRKYTTASTVSVTLSRVMHSWVGTDIATIRMLTLTRWSTPNGTTIVRPGVRSLGRSRPKRNTSPRSYCCTVLSEVSSSSTAITIGTISKMITKRNHSLTAAGTGYLSLF